MTVRVLIPMAMGMEELEFITVSDLCVRAGFDVVRASIEDDLEIAASRGARLMADGYIEEFKQLEFDAIVLPGGLPGADRLANNSCLISLLQRQDEAKTCIAAICAAPKVLALHQIATGHRLACYPGALNELDTSNYTLVADAVSDDGHLLTSRGPGTAMDFALALIAKLAGTEARAVVEAPLVRG